MHRHGCELRVSVRAATPHQHPLRLSVLGSGSVPSILHDSSLSSFISEQVRRSVLRCAAGGTPARGRGLRDSAPIA
eukprot:scaffold15022_cov117-Isochrysis_galbana.AAC.7